MDITTNEKNDMEAPGSTFWKTPRFNQGQKRLQHQDGGPDQHHRLLRSIKPKNLGSGVEANNKRDTFIWRQNPICLPKKSACPENVNHVDAT